MTKEQYVEKCKKTHDIEYNYSKIPNFFSAKEKPYFEIGCPNCNTYFRVRYDQFQSGSNCPNCSKTGRKIDSSVLERLKEIHPELDFSKSTYSGVLNPITFFCKIHGEQTLLADSLLSPKSGCPVCKLNSLKKSKEEIIQPNFSYDFDKEFYASTEKIKITCLKCNNTFTQQVRLHLKGKCPICSRKEAAKNKILPIEVLEDRLENLYPNKYILYETTYKTYKTKVKFFCKTCQKAISILPAHLVESGCPICSRKNMGIAKMKSQEEVEKEIKALCGDKFTYLPFKWDSDRTRITFTCLKHNNIFTKSISTIRTNGICCPSCKPKSKAEKRLNEFLIDNGYKLGEDYLFNEVMFSENNTSLHTDFYFIKKKIWIELNGIQHKKWTPIFQKTLHDFHKQKHHDWLKRRYCRKNGIKFFEIWYWEDEIEKIKSILK